MSDGHRTSSIPRPRGRAAHSTVDASGSDSTRFTDFTRPIRRDKQLVKGRGKRLLFVLGTTAVAFALMAALFVLPVKAWFRQGDDVATKQHQLDVLDEANAQLNADVTRLNTPDGIREAARSEIGFVDPGEQRVTVMPSPNAPVALPRGWPYDAVAQILAVRSAQAAAATAAAAAAASTAAP